jgi:hypothetical protein
MLKAGPYIRYALEDAERRGQGVNLIRPPINTATLSLPLYCATAPKPLVIAMPGFVPKGVGTLYSVLPISACPKMRTHPYA